MRELRRQGSFGRTGCAMMLTALAAAALPHQSVVASKAPQSALPVLEPSPHRVRILISRSTEPQRLRGFDLRFSRGKDQVFISADRNTRWEIRCTASEVSLRDGRTGRVHRVKGAIEASSPAGFVFHNDRPVRESLRFHASARGCEIVNLLDLEKYLDGLVNAEFSSRWHPESVAAQVVAARTYALHQIRAAARIPGRSYDMVATEHDQVYGGAVIEDFRASRAVRRTRGLVLATSAEPVAPIKAYYHSSCGGRTELPERVWGGRSPAMDRKVKCGFCDGAPSSAWTYDVDSTELLARVAEGAERDGAPLGWPADWRAKLRGKKLHRVRIRRWPDDQRVKEIDLVLSESSGLRNGWFELSISGAKLRSWIGATRLRSTDFEVALDPKSQAGKWVFRGKGNGHGVGMCQWGAKRMGERGFTMASILKHYYPGAIVKKMW